MSRETMDHVLGLVRSGVLAIDAEGRVWRHAAIVHGELKTLGEPRRAENVSGKGYFRITVQINGKLASVMAHRLVWEAANGPIPDELQVNHKDLDKKNNRLGNLEIVTGSGNIRHSYANGRTVPWSRARRDGRTWRGKPLVTDEQKQQAKALRASGETWKAISFRLGISLTHTQRIAGAP